MSTLLPPPAKEPSFLRRVVVSFFLFALLLFVSAGRLYWLRGWLFLALTSVLMWIAVIHVGRVNSELFEARKRVQKGTQRWDKVLLVFISMAYAAILIIAALDDGRFHWAPQPWRGVAVGWFVYSAAFMLVTWAEGVNRFFEPGVRIQTDRGHHVIDTGPYAVVRHPGYLAAIFLAIGTALSLGSLWALIPAAVTIAILILRTALEDRLLQRELPGYKAYTQKTRYRLLPGLW